MVERLVKWEAPDGMTSILFGVACRGAGQPSLGLVMCGPAPIPPPQASNLRAGCRCWFQTFSFSALGCGARTPILERNSVSLWYSEAT